MECTADDVDDDDEDDEEEEEESIGEIDINQFLMNLDDEEE